MPVGTEAIEVANKMAKILAPKKRKYKVKAHKRKMPNKRAKGYILVSTFKLDVPRAILLVKFMQKNKIKFKLG